MKNVTRTDFQFYGYHLVKTSPWPIVTSFAMLCLTIFAVLFFQGFEVAGLMLSFGFCLVVGAMCFWFRDIITESTYLGDHTIQVQKGITIGIGLFIFMEAFTFLSVFWAFFHSSLAPSIEIGSAWPPAGIEALDPFAIPLLNTIVLLTSGVCHKCNLSDVLLLSSTLPFITPRVKSELRIGPHNYNILCILIGSLLGDGSMEKRGDGSRFEFYQEKKNGEYLL